MLVLSRKINEVILIDGQIEVVVLGVEGDTVKLGVAAPREVGIYRKELYQSIREANKSAVQSQVPLGKLAGLVKPGAGGLLGSGQGMVPGNVPELGQNNKPDK